MPYVQLSKEIVMKLYTWEGVVYQEAESSVKRSCVECEYVGENSCHSFRWHVNTNNGKSCLAGDTLVYKVYSEEADVAIITIDK